MMKRVRNQIEMQTPVLCKVCHFVHHDYSSDECKQRKDEQEKRNEQDRRKLLDLAIDCKNRIKAMQITFGVNAQQRSEK